MPLHKHWQYKTITFLFKTRDSNSILRLQRNITLAAIVAILNLFAIANLHRVVLTQVIDFVTWLRAPEIARVQGAKKVFPYTVSLLTDNFAQRRKSRCKAFYMRYDITNKNNILCVRILENISSLFLISFVIPLLLQRRIIFSWRIRTVSIDRYRSSVGDIVLISEKNHIFKMYTL